MSIPPSNTNILGYQAKSKQDVAQGKTPRQTIPSVGTANITGTAVVSNGVTAVGGIGLPTTTLIFGATAILVGSAQITSITSGVVTTVAPHPFTTLQIVILNNISYLAVSTGANTFSLNTFTYINGLLAALVVVATVTGVVVTATSPTIYTGYNETITTNASMASGGHTNWRKRVNREIFQVISGTASVFVFNSINLFFEAVFNLN